MTRLRKRAPKVSVIPNGPTVGALNAESPKRTYSNIPRAYCGHGIRVFLTDLHHILHARNCIHFRLFPHARWHPRPLKRSQN